MRLTYMTAAVLAGLIAGTLDIGAAALINLVDPRLVLRAVARGLLGKAAPLDVPVMALGLVLQWAMSIVIAGVFMLAASRAPVLARRWALSGLAYGVVIFLVMNYVVVPLSAIHAAALQVASVHAGARDGHARLRADRRLVHKPGEPRPLGVGLIGTGRACLSRHADHRLDLA